MSVDRGSMKYTIYMNRVHKYASIHEESCSYVKMHGGVSTTIPPTGGYYEDIDTVEAARREAASTGLEVRMCSHCKP